VTARIAVALVLATSATAVGVALGETGLTGILLVVVAVALTVGLTVAAIGLLSIAVTFLQTPRLRYTISFEGHLAEVSGDQTDDAEKFVHTPPPQRLRLRAIAAWVATASATAAGITAVVAFTTLATVTAALLAGLAALLNVLVALVAYIGYVAGRRQRSRD
jgi:hypothetical protein